MKVGKRDIKYIIFVVMVLSLLIPFNLSTSLTNSGIVKVYLANFIYLYFFGILFFVCLRKWKEFERNTKKQLLLYTCIGIIYFIVMIVRFLLSTSFYKSLEMFFWTYMAISMFFLVRLEILQREKFTRVLFVSITAINVVSFIYHILIVRSLRSEYLGNINIIVFFSIIGGFVNFIYAFNCKKVNSFWVFFNVFYYTYVFIVSGSRAGLVLGGITTVFLLLYSYHKKILKKEISFGIFFAIIIATICIYFNFYYSRDLFLRGSNLGTIGDSIKDAKNSDEITYDAVERLTEISENVDVDEYTKEERLNEILKLNDVGRFSWWKEAIKEIKKSPLIGTGVVTVGNNGLGSNQAAHNFILEYWLIYGGIGIFFWMLFVLNILIDGIIRLKRAGYSDRIVFLIAFMVLVCAYSFVQPTLVSAVGPLLVWSSLSALFPDREGISCNNS